MPSTLQNKILDPAFQNKYAALHNLLVDVGEGFDCTIVEEKTQIIRGISPNKSNLALNESSFEREDLLSHPFHNTFISLKNIPFCLTPNAFFSEDKQRELLETLAEIPEDYIVAHSNLINISAKAVFAYPKFYAKAFRFLANKKILCFASLLADFAAMEFKKLKENQIIVNIEEKYFTLAIYTEKGLQLCNDFQYSNKEDFAYYLLFSLEQNHISSNKIQLSCMGKTNDQDLFSMLEEFIPKIHFYDYAEQPFKRSKSLDSLSETMLFAKTLPLLCA